MERSRKAPLTTVGPGAGTWRLEFLWTLGGGGGRYPRRTAG